MRSTLEAISSNINAGNFQSAVHIGQQAVYDGELADDANFYFQFALATELIGEDAENLYEKARQCPNFTPYLEGDILRNSAEKDIRTGETARAQAKLEHVRQLHEGDLNRIAAIHMDMGRIRFSQRMYATALHEHATADLEWARLGPTADAQWIANNRFHWLKAAAAHSKYGLVRKLYDEIMATEPRRDKRIAVWTMRWFGVLSIGLIRRIAR